MRFIADGPTIPDGLLIARDEGRVVFFCGAGVSRAKANLPDFFGLAGNVIDSLNVPDDHVVRKILREAGDVEKRVGVGGLISADRLFGWLERDFRRSDVENAVAKALAPNSPVDLSAHRILLRLATTPQGRTQLVTTNFDRLFNDCDPKLKVWQPPSLPRFDIETKLDGVIYLHGRATDDYKAAENDGFILSSSSFGQAYLSDAWATSFLKEVINRYAVVFVGYTADDPPVLYLLEALSNAVGRLDGVYAFQSGDLSEASAKWQHKGVTAIPYDAADRHAALWSTLEAWAERADDVDAWKRKVIERAKHGPYDMLPHEWGQVAHLAMTTEGIRQFCDPANALPSDWVCVLDPAIRFAAPGFSNRYTDDEERVDPFELFGLDSDETPAIADPEDPNPARTMPKGSWSGLQPTSGDRETVGPFGAASIVNHSTSNPPPLPPRLAMISGWLAHHAHQPAALWWAARQSSFHPHLQQDVDHGFRDENSAATPEIRKAWRELFSASESRVRRDHMHWYDVQQRIARDGWDVGLVYALSNSLRPYLNVKVEPWSAPVPARSDLAEPANIILRDVEYPDGITNFAVPAEFRQAVARELRRNLEVARDLELSLGGYRLDWLAPIRPSEEGDDFGRGSDLNGLFFQYIHILDQLLADAPSMLAQEIAAWPIEDTLFARLRIWALSRSDVSEAEKCLNLFSSLSDKAVWSDPHQRDLLFALQRRWPELDEPSRAAIEDWLLAGPPVDQDDASPERELHAVFRIVERLSWMEANGVDLSERTRGELVGLRARLPDWKPEFANEAVNSTEVHVYSVETDTSYSALLSEPSARIIPSAQAIGGRSVDRRTQHSPFQGLANDRPLKALAALRAQLRIGQFPGWAWKDFLGADGRKNDSAKLKRLIAERLLTASRVINVNLHEVSRWFLTASKDMHPDCASTFDAILDAIIQAMTQDLTKGASGVSKRKRQRDWAMEALNAPTGNLAQALFNDPRAADAQANRDFDPKWLANAEALLALPGDLRRHALTLICYHLMWFYATNSAWTEKHVLSVLSAGDQDDADAVWAGFLWRATTPQPELYALLKPHLLLLAKERDFDKRGYAQVLAGIILVGWGTVPQGGNGAMVSDKELRNLILESGEDFRRNVLWQAGRLAKDDRTDRSATTVTWQDSLLRLIRDVWPRQFSVRTPTISSRLCDIAFESADRFPEFVDAVLPLLTTIDSEQMFLPTLRQATPTIIDRFPAEALTLLYAILPTNARAWPFGTEDALTVIGKNSALAGDARLLELRRRADAR